MLKVEEDDEAKCVCFKSWCFSPKFHCENMLKKLCVVFCLMLFIEEIKSIDNKAKMSVVRHMHWFIGKACTDSQKGSRKQKAKNLPLNVFKHSCTNSKDTFCISSKSPELLCIDTRIHVSLLETFCFELR
jgi:hypothetical protein